jgi:hypothetical protein
LVKAKGEGDTHVEDRERRATCNIFSFVFSQISYSLLCSFKLQFVTVISVTRRFEKSNSPLSMPPSIVGKAPLYMPAKPENHTQNMLAAES